MKHIVINLEKMIGFAFVSIIFLSMSCGKATVNPVSNSTSLNAETGVGNINLIGLKSDSGYAYKIGYNLPESGDSNTAPRVSTLRLFENGVELGPAHSVHADIRNYGLGQFSHWGTELFFSTSDNSNPLTNGRKYTYRMN